MLVTGGTGYLGRALEPIASAAGWTVISVGSTDADIRDPVAVDRLTQRARPDVVVHTAYVKDAPAATAVIVDGTANVARAAVAAGARLLHVSTDVVFDGQAGRPYCERDPPTPVTDYGRAKAESERVVASTAPTALVVRTSLIYGGPHGPSSSYEIAAHDPTATFYSDEVRCPIQVHDLAAALVELATSYTCGVLHVAGPEALTRQAFAERIAGRRVRATPAPSGRPLDCRLDITRAAGILTALPRGVSDVYAG
jgi:dTDP-4-dehydrorhamnose reductase